MNEIFNFIANHSITLVFGILLLFGFIEAIFGYLSNSNRTKDDILIESFNTFCLFVITKPIVAFVSFGLTELAFPSKQNMISHWSVGLMILVFILVDDFLQYWYHRSSHEYKWLWTWHRPHHAAKEMGLLVSYREAIYFYIFMPNMWFMGIFTFLGGGTGVVIGLVLKQAIVISAHSLVTWDSFFYKRPALMPILKVLERIFITPAFHHAHHGISIIDGISNPNGNFGNMLSIWDQMFGSAKFTHKFPTKYGLETDMNDSWLAHSFYPIITSDKKGSEISKDYKFEKTTTLEPSELHLTPGDYLYCQCGFSKNQPFCDGSHHGTKAQPLKFTIKKEMDYKLCNCKLCVKGPFCDNSHLKVKHK